MKKILLGIIIGIIIFVSGIYAASVYYANDISYQPSDESWNVSNVNEAINSLYDMKINKVDEITIPLLSLSGTATAAHGNSTYIAVNGSVAGVFEIDIKKYSSFSVSNITGSVTCTLTNSNGDSETINLYNDISVNLSSYDKLKLSLSSSQGGNGSTTSLTARPSATLSNIIIK